MTLAFQEVLINQQADLEETDVVVVEEGEAADEDAFGAEGEHADALEDDAPQSTSEEEKTEETDVVVVEEGEAADKDAVGAEEERTLEDDAPQSTSLEEKTENTEVLEDSNKKKCRIFSVFLDATTVYRIAFRVSWVPIICQFVNYFVTLALFPGLVTSMQSESLGLGDWFPVILVTVV